MKTMKKSMFITTIMMVVLLVVALSTATFAWYTAQASVSVTSTSVSSASSESASLVIDTAAANSIDAKNSTITLTTDQSIMPMIYHSTSDPDTNVTYGNFINSFYTCVVDNAGYLAQDASTTSAGKIVSVKGSPAEAAAQNYFVLTNVGGRVLDSLKITVNTTHYTFKAKEVEAGETTADLYETNDGSSVALPADSTNTTGAKKTYYERIANSNDNLNVAVFAGSSSAASAMTLKAVYGKAKYTKAELSNLIATKHAQTTFGNLDFGELKKTSGDEVVIATNVTANAGEGSAVFVALAVWFEGEGMENSMAGTTAQFTISFK